MAFCPPFWQPRCRSAWVSGRAYIVVPRGVLLVIDVAASHECFSHALEFLAATLARSHVLSHALALSKFQCRGIRLCLSSSTLLAALGLTALLKWNCSLPASAGAFPTLPRAGSKSRGSGR